MSPSPDNGRVDARSGSPRQVTSTRRQPSRRPAPTRAPLVFDAQDRRAITANRGERILAERGLAGIAHEEVQPQAENAINHGKLEHSNKITAVNKNSTKQQPDHEHAAH